MSACVFCSIVAGDAPADVVRVWEDAVAFRPLGPISEDHVLIVPRVHVADFAADPGVSGAVMGRVAEFARPAQHVAVNIGSGAGQSVFHLHVHVWSCFQGDMPWETG